MFTLKLVHTLQNSTPYKYEDFDIRNGYFNGSGLLFQKQDRRFQSTDEVKIASQAELKNMAKNGFQKCFYELYKRWQKCAVAQVFYFEGGCVSAV
ncbi:hypothetical protein TNCV_1077121 [Trichonephila clavipes]|uniref:Uncharacterized protein n=1 Tax=Trichonephila clavipes TaxID=2585209 RepID=A0A8X6RTQ1_TRICX|nr:hypothetical protein TNCV_1077121 [Trichonephila clavipes]